MGTDDIFIICIKNAFRHKPESIPPGVSPGPHTTYSNIVYAESLYSLVPNSSNVFCICFLTTWLRDNANVALRKVCRSACIGRSRIFNALFLLK